MAKFLKMNEQTQNIPIVFLTAEFKEKEFEQALDAFGDRERRYGQTGAQVQ